MITPLFMWIVGNGDFFIKWGCILTRKRKQDWKSWKGKIWLFILLSVLALILTIKSMQQIIQVGDLIVMFLEIRVVKVV